MVSSVRIETPGDNLNGVKKRKNKLKSNRNKANKTDAIKISKSLDDSENIENEVKVETKLITTDQNEKYPVLQDEELVKKFLAVPLTNNQKGRIRQLMKQQLKDTSDTLLPDVINSRIQAIIKETEVLTESDLRKIRILHNMLKTSLHTETPEKKKNKNKKNKKKKDKGVKDDEKKDKDDDKKDELKKEGKDSVNKVKGPKRYVVFVGNLPPNIEQEKVMNHFKELKDHILSVRVPKQEEGKKSSIAYVELKNEHSYELALSKHHSMLDNKRINVLYTTQKNSKVSKTEAKSKSAKLIALQKSGKLAGSVPLNKKRSQRRAKAKRAQAKLEAMNK